MYIFPSVIGSLYRKNTPRLQYLEQAYSADEKLKVVFCINFGLVRKRFDYSLHTVVELFIIMQSRTALLAITMFDYIM